MAFTVLLLCVLRCSELRWRTFGVDDEYFVVNDMSVQRRFRFVDKGRADGAGS